MDELPDLNDLPGFDQLLGVDYTELGAEVARAEFDVRDELRQPFGLLHGGVFTAVAESLTSIATVAHVFADGKIGTGLANQTSFLRPALEGRVYATAKRRHVGRTTWVWDVEFTGPAGELYAVTRMTIAVRDRRSSPASRP